MPAVTNVSVNLDEIPSSAWPIDATAIADTDLATLARAMATVVLDGYGAVIAYPDTAAGTTRVRLEWQLERVAALTRALVFAELAARTGVKLIGPPLRVSVRDRTGIEGSVRSKPNTRLAMKVHAGRPMYAVAEPGMPLHIGLRDLVGAPTTATDLR